jgi:hypothetical protein
MIEIFRCGLNFNVIVINAGEINGLVPIKRASGHSQKRRERVPIARIGTKVDVGREAQFEEPAIVVWRGLLQAWNYICVPGCRFDRDILNVADTSGARRKHGHWQQSGQYLSDNILPEVHFVRRLSDGGGFVTLGEMTLHCQAISAGSPIC